MNEPERQRTRGRLQGVRGRQPWRVLRLLALNFAVKPGLGVSPVLLDGAFGQAQNFGGIGGSHPEEETQLDDLGLHPTSCGQLVERVEEEFSKGGQLGYHNTLGPLLADYHDNLLTDFCEGEHSSKKPQCCKEDSAYVKWIRSKRTVRLLWAASCRLPSRHQGRVTQ